MKTTITQDDAERIKTNGRKAVKKPNPVFLMKMDHEFEVQTAEGLMHAAAGSFVAHDPISGHVWAVTEDYVIQHYDFFPDEA